MASLVKDLKNVQGDILLGGLNKEVETFWFFTIADGQEKKFCQNLRTVANQEISHTQHALDTQRKIKDLKNNRDSSAAAPLPTIGANISFSFKGLQKIAKVTGISTETGDAVFQAGMKPKAVKELEDPPKPNSDGTTPAWDEEWLTKQIDGVLVVAGNTTDLVKAKLDKIVKLFDGSVKLAFKMDGKVRPGEFRHHEHFGYNDGISQPFVESLPSLSSEEATVPKGQDTVKQGVILCGRDGDAQLTARPPWMVDGSFLAFRKLKQNVQDWDKFLVDSSNKLGTWSGLLGARLIGRWKSGCPINLQPDFDDKNIGKDPLRNNDFSFDPPEIQGDFHIKAGDRLVCPFGAHIRKTNPRGDLGREVVDQFRIVRRGIPYGPEISENPTAERGLLFACYQSNLDKGFEFIQRRWANKPDFRFEGGGVDAVMGQINTTKEIPMLGLFPQDASRPLNLPGVNRFVVPRGGEYFFSPSLAALKGELSDVSGRQELKL